MMSPANVGPGIVGTLRPVLLLPHQMREHLSLSEFAAVLAHEKHHLVRRDNLTALLHRLVQVLFWFHPLVWWIGERLVAERELACDEEVLNEGHAPDTYAQGILAVCEQHLQTRVQGMARATGG